MSFEEPDPIEQDMGVRVETMFPDQLVAYFKLHQETMHGLVFSVEGNQERAVFRTMQDIYGKPDAGRIVKWVTYHHKGKYEGVPVRFASFCRARKWWVDLMHLEMQQALQKDEESAARRSGPSRVLDF